jgi:hypothetical protein
MDFEILASLDTDDETMNNPIMKAWMEQRKDCLTVVWGESKSKIDAINRDVDKAKPWDILVNTSDDMWFIRRGFDDLIRKDMGEKLTGVLHYDDGRINGKKIMTMSIMGRKYYDMFGYIYHPDYKSFYSDNEATEVAKLSGYYKYSGERLFDHMHPTEGLGKMDEQYTNNNRNWAHDEEVFSRRKAINFGL